MCNRRVTAASVEQAYEAVAAAKVEIAVYGVAMPTAMGFGWMVSLHRRVTAM